MAFNASFFVTKSSAEVTEVSEKIVSLEAREAFAAYGEAKTRSVGKMEAPFPFDPPVDELLHAEEQSTKPSQSAVKNVFLTGPSPWT
ncbi:MAG: hypothetical protein V1495_00145 [Pseudomonadota bacterium]